MRLRMLGTGLVIAAAAIATTALAGPNAYASQGGGHSGGGNGGSGRPCGSASATSGQGTLGSAFTLKSMYDDDGAVPGVVVGEEFEIETPAGQQWTVQLADNGVVFFDQTVISDAAGIKGMSMTPAQPGNQVMTAHADNPVTGETVDGTVTLAPPPARCADDN